MVNTIYSTVDKGHLHIAFDQHYQGEINGYNNVLTRFFAKLFRVSVNVSINDKTRCLNKKSYVNFLKSQNIPGVSLDIINQFKNFNNLHFERLRNDRGFMHQNLSNKKSISLAKKLAQALSSRNIYKAQHLLGKGANVNQSFWIRDYDRQILFKKEFTSDLPHQRLESFQVTNYTPLILSLDMKERAFAQKLQTFGADKRLGGKTLTFKREIMRVDNHAYLEFKPQVHGQPHRTRLERVNKQTITFQDTYENIYDITIDQERNRLIKTPAAKGSQTVRWSKTDEVGRQQLF